MPNIMPKSGRRSPTTSSTSISSKASGVFQTPSRLIKTYEDEFGISAVPLKPRPFKLRWMHGYNHNVGVINLNKMGNTTLFYSASNCGVLYNWTTNHMWLLQGHRHIVSNIASDAKGEWLVTADSGPENVIIIWDFKDLFPQRTLFSPHGNAKIAKLALSADAKFMLTLAYPSGNMALFWWIWSQGQDTPHAIFQASHVPRDSVVEIGFNPWKTDQFLLMTRFNIFIGNASKIILMERGIERVTDQWQLKVNAQERVNPEYGKLMCYAFVGSTSQIIVGTSRGAVLVYGYTIEYNVNAESRDIDTLRYIKMLKLQKRMIHCIKNVDGVVVMGNSAGEIYFYDDQLKLLYWVHGFTVDRVKRLSFNLSPRSYEVLDPTLNPGPPIITHKDKTERCPCWEQVEVERDPETGEVKQKLVKKRLPTDASVTGKPFLVRDFVVCTFNQGVGFVDFVTEKYMTILDHRRSFVISLTVHPEKYLLCVGSKDGALELYNFVEHKMIKRLDLKEKYTVVVPPDEDSINCNYEYNVPELSITCLQYAPSGLHLACGLNTGELMFLDPTTIDILNPSPFTDTKGAIDLISFCMESALMATADSERTVCVYNYCCKFLQWQFVGKYRSHYKDITALTFLPAKAPSGEFKLISLGMDRCMVEYDIGASHDGLLTLASLDRVEQTAIPLDVIVWPTPSELNPEECRTHLPTVLMATDEFKYKIVNYKTAMTLSTVLGPRYDHPVSKMQLITKRQDEDADKYLLFSCKEVVGLQKLPLDGNPWKHVALLGHPKHVLQMCFREDLGILFIIGAKDTSISQWGVQYRAVDATAKRGGGDLDPYYCLVEDGRPGWLFHEIRDLFYYIQILCQGTFSPARRLVKDYIPVDSLPDLMRALGYFPSEYEVENLLVEAKYKVYLRKPATEIDFEEFVKLYLNHRPAFGETYKRLRAAFHTFGEISPDQEFFIRREDFIEMLTTNGEFFSRELCWYLLTVLCGHSSEDRALMNEDDFSFLPEIINFSDFVNEIIGIQEPEFDSTSCMMARASSLTLTSIDSDEKLNQ